MRRFFAYLSRLKLISRWGLMRNTLTENDAEHSFQAAVIAHGIALTAVARFGRNIDPEYVTALALYHDAHEVITGDMPTPVKYHNPRMRKNVAELETEATALLLDLLPRDLRTLYRPYLQPDETSLEWRIVKAADRICAYIKCVEENRAGNREFDRAAKTVLASIKAIDLPEVQAFFDETAPGFGMTLDELSRAPGKNAAKAGPPAQDK